LILEIFIASEVKWITNNNLLVNAANYPLVNLKIYYKPKIKRIDEKS